MSKYQELIDHIRDICRQYGVVLVAVSEDKSVYGEIEIFEQGRHLPTRDFNLVKELKKSSNKGNYCVEAIG